MKRKADDQNGSRNGKGILKKRAKTILSDEEVQKSFRKTLFDKESLEKHSKDYSTSEPYKHGVIDSLIDDKLLRAVRNEIRENVHFTPKETDIYKIHQSGDLANLDGLDDGALERLPSLLRLRDALYSSTFRKYIARITGSGELSGRKTDMAINVYTPGCHLLCHDDVIGSRKVSYILYLTDPDVPWKAGWGGALRLYPTQTFSEDNGEKTKTPTPDFSRTIPPAWNQLSFFAVQPGESFHDVEEVYHAPTVEQLEEDGGRIRMAISGWYHIPQIGEDGYTKGAEEKWGANSSLMQLQGHPDRYDFPQPETVTLEIPEENSQEKSLEEADLEFLLKYMAPAYLTPDTLEEVADRFLNLSSVTLDGLLSQKFSNKIRDFIEAQASVVLPAATSQLEASTSWKVAKPPHKHRFLYQQRAQDSRAINLNPLEELLEVFIPSSQFRRWLEIATQCDIENYDILARRFRRGLDYALATSHEGKPRLEMSLGLTPTTGWTPEDEEEDDEVKEKDQEIEEANGSSNKTKTSTKPSNRQGDNEQTGGEERDHEAEDTIGSSDKTETSRTIYDKKKDPREDFSDVGGHEVYMAGDEDEAGGDAAVYKTSADVESDGVLFTMPASWNKMSIVLRDSGVLRFVKYVSQSARGDRWDVMASFDVREVDEEEEEKEEEGVVTLENTQSSDEEVFNGFPDSGESDSD